MDELVANLREAYRVSINELDWMTPQTRERALAKLDKFTAQDRLSGASGGTIRSWSSSATTCTATTGAATPSATTASWPSSAARSTATSGS